MSLDTSYRSISKHIARYAVKNGTESRAFLAWFLENYYRLDELEVFDCLCDGKNDKGIDGIYVNEQQRKIDFFQTTLAQSDNKKQGDNRLKTFAGTLAQFEKTENAEKILKVAGTDLKALAARSNLIKRIGDGFEIRGIFVTNASADSSAKTYLSTGPRIVLYDGVRLKAEFITIDKTKPIQAAFKFDVSAVPALELEMGTKLSMVVAPISARELIQMEGVSNGDLFAWNVRQFLGKGTAVNKAVAESIKKAEEHKYFPAFHNGVTILCEKLKTSDKVIEIGGYAVVNGCQSITSLYENSESITPDLRILTKFIQVEPDSKLAGKITDHTNNQNGASSRDLQSNNTIHTRLQTQIHAKYPEYRYRIKRGEHPEWDKRSVIENELLGRILLALDLDRPEAWSQNYKLFGELHGDIFGRPQVNADRAIYALDIYNAVMAHIGEIEDQLFATYSLTKWLAIALVRDAILLDSDGKRLHENPTEFFSKPRGRKRVQKCLASIALTVARILNGEVKRKKASLKEGEYFDYKNDLKNREFLKDWESRLTTQYHITSDTLPELMFGKKWAASAKL